METRYQVQAARPDGSWFDCGPESRSYSAALDHLERARLLVSAHDWTIYSYEVLAEQHRRSFR